MLVADARQAMICRHEQVVSADMAGSIERRSFGSHCSGKGVPLYLLIVSEVPPLLESSLMDGKLHLLPCSTGKGRVRFRLEKAFSVLVEECDVADRGIAVGEKRIGDIFRHSLKVRICKVRQNSLCFT